MTNNYPRFKLTILQKVKTFLLCYSEPNHLCVNTYTVAHTISDCCYVAQLFLFYVFGISAAALGRKELEQEEEKINGEDRHIA